MRANLVLVRFVAEAAAIVAAAVIAGPVLHLVWWQVGIVVFLVLGGGILFESMIASRQAPAPVAVPPPPPAEEESHVHVLAERPAAEPVPEPVPAVEQAPEPEPVAVAVAAPPVRVSGPPWNVWELERALETTADGDDEKSFLLHYLRDYAGPDGMLPPEFDDLVRESFGPLL